MKILVIGGGNMGLTFAQSFLKSKIVTSDNMLILEKSAKKADQLKELNIGTVHGEPGVWIKDCDLIILAVKPQDIQRLFDTIKDYIGDQQVVLSIMAGVTIDAIKQGLNITKVIRAMPNLPAQVGIGMTAFTSSDEVTRIELVMVQNLLNATGKTIYVDAENDIDASTAISGSGPAYVFYFMQGLIEQAKELGFSQSEAELLTYQTFKGAIELYNKHNLSCDEWIKKVSSKGGTTEAAFQVFNKEAINELFKRGVNRAYERSKELSE